MPPQSNVKKLLIIDDDLSIRFILKKFLGKYIGDQLEIYTSENGVQGLGYAFILKPDIIIIDSTLPKYSGRELVDYLVTNNNFTNIPIILLNEDVKVFDNLPLNYSQTSKVDKAFPQNLIAEIYARLNLSGEYNSEKNTLTFKTVNFLARKVVSLSNKSFIEKNNSDRGNFLYRFFKNIEFVLDQISAGVYMTIFYILMGRNDYELNIEQKKRDLSVYRRKVYPTMVIGIATLGFILMQLILIICSVVSLSIVATK